MKNLKKIFLLTLIAGALSSCTDAYEIVQEGEFQEEFAFETVSDLNLGLISVYDQVSNESEIAFVSVFTDETAIGDQNGGQNLTDYRQQLFATNDYASGIWSGHYATINYINRLIAGAEGIVLDPASDTFAADEIEKARIVAEARALRAYCTLQLLTFFSTNLQDDAALGVIILDHVPPVLPNLEQLPRSTNLECFNFINADLDFAEDNLGGSTVPIYVSPALVYGIRARMAAYRANWTDAQTFANQAIAAKTSASPAQSALKGLGFAGAYAGIWADTTTPSELIFDLLRPRNKSGVVSNWFFNGASLDGGAFLDMDRNLYFELTENSRDVRQTFIGASSLIAPNYATVFDYKTKDVIIINKYPGTPASNLPLNNNLKPMRTVEMHYILAEAQIANGDLAGARTTINFVRRTRNTAVTTIAHLTATAAAQSAMDISTANFDTPQEGWVAVLDERRRELCFEGHRYIDLKRLGVAAGVTTVQRYERDCEPYSACGLSVTDYRFTMPIPNDELNGNQVIREQQNPGY